MQRSGGLLQRKLQALAFAEGDMVMVRECARGGRQILLGPLTEKGLYESHRGVLRHKDIIGLHPREQINAVTKAGLGGRYRIQYPTLEDYVLLSKRKCTPIYPKDSSAIVSMLDISPGDWILEAGTGNGGLTMHLARAVGPSGTVFTVDRSQERSEHAKEIIGRFQRGALSSSISFHAGSVDEVVYDIAAEVDPDCKPRLAEIAKCGWEASGGLAAPLFDGLVLDMPMPWNQLSHVLAFLRTDRFAVCYLPNISQVMYLVRACHSWPLIVEDVVEVKWRSWEVRSATIRNLEQIDDPSTDNAMICRPTHEPTAHTAFLVKLRKCSPMKDPEPETSIQ